MSIRIFYSWQSDSDPSVNKDFVEAALDEAIGSLAEDALLDMPAELDRDTKDLPGSPDFLAAILQKIEHSSIFVADLTPVANTISRPGRPQKMQPNSNVTIEYGHALATLGEESIIGVLNAAYGAPEDLPSDIKAHMVRCTYRLRPGDTDQDSVKRDLANNLESQIKSIVERIAFRGLPPHVALLAKYFVENSPLGREDGGPWLSEAEIVATLGLTPNQAHEAIDWLLGLSYVQLRPGSGTKIVFPAASLFESFDKAWLRINPMRVAKKVAEFIIDKDMVQTADIAQALGYKARQMNPALSFLLRSNFVERSKNVDPADQFIAYSIRATPLARQFARGVWPPKTRPGLRG